MSTASSTLQPASSRSLVPPEKVSSKETAELVDLASVEGLDGVTIGRLAEELSISKSGLFAHFGSKEALQLATIRAARAIFSQTVVVPALSKPAGMARLRSLVDGWIDYSRGREFPGGCFFSRATHEYASRPGAVRDALAEVDEEWLRLLAATIEEARGAGEVRSDLAHGLAAMRERS